MRDRNLYDRRTGGAGSRTLPLSDEDYRRQRRKLERLNAADAEDDN